MTDWIKLRAVYVIVNVAIIAHVIDLLVRGSAAVNAGMLTLTAGWLVYNGLILILNFVED